MTRLWALVAVLGVAALPGASSAADPFEIHAILPLTGTNAFSGRAEAQSLSVIERMTNQSGGIGGREVKFVIEDEQSNPTIAVQMASAAIAARAQVFLGPSLVADCNAILPLLRDGPVMYCFSPGFHPPKDSFGFSSNTSTTDLLADNMRYFREMGWKKIALVASSDASGQDGERSIDAAINLPENAGMTVVDREHFNTADLSVSAQMAHIKASGAQAWVAYATGTPFATLLRGAADADLQLPVSSTNANAYSEQLKAYAGFIPRQLLFAGQMHQAPESLPKGPVKTAVDAYYAAFKTIGVRPEGINALAWDSTLIVLSAFKKLGTGATAAQIHDFIENVHGFVGVNGEYDFRDGSQRGIGQMSGFMLRWDPAKNVFVGVSKPGGYLR